MTVRSWGSKSHSLYGGTCDFSGLGRASLYGRLRSGRDRRGSLRSLAPLPVPNGLGKRTEIRLLEPRFAQLGDEQRREAVALLADLLLDAARKRACVSGSASDGVIDGASGSVVPFPERRGKARRCGRSGR